MASATSGVVRSAADAARERIWQHFTHPDTQMFYDFAHRHAGFPYLPTPDEIARHFPNAAGWCTGMENGVLNATLHLQGLLLRHRLTGDPVAAEQARFYFAGLKRLCAAATDPGFLPRALGLDGISHYVNSSADQYTMFFLALLRYFQSSLATDDDRSTIRRIWQSVLARWERDGWEDRREDGLPAIYGDLGSLRPDRSSRLLEALLGGAVITGDRRWRLAYERAVAEQDRARITDGMPRAGAALYVFDQNQTAWRLLYELEDDPSLKAVYRRWLTETAAAVRDRILEYRKFSPVEHRAKLAATDWDWRHAVEPPGVPQLERSSPLVRRVRETMPVRWYEHLLVQEPLEAAHVLLLSGDDESLRFLGEHLAPLMASFPFETLVFAGSVDNAEAVCWLACDYGLA